MSKYIKNQNVLIIGQGSIANQHKSNLNEFELNIFQISSSSSLEKIKEKIIELNIEYVIICSISSKHYDGIMACLHLNKFFYCEKPFVLSATQLLEINKYLKKKSHNIHSSCIGFNLRYHPLIGYAKKLIETNQGCISFNFKVGHDVTKWRKGRDINSLFSLNRSKGGGAISELSHEIDLACYICRDMKNIDVISILDPWKKSVDGQSIITSKARNFVGSIYLDIVSSKLFREFMIVTKDLYMHGNLVTQTLEIKDSKRLRKKIFNYDRNSILRKSLIMALNYAFSDKQTTVPLNLVRDCNNSSSIITKAYEQSLVKLEK